MDIMFSGASSDLALGTMVHQAVTVLSSDLHVSHCRALELIAGRAQANRQTMTAVASDVLNGDWHLTTGL